MTTPNTNCKICGFEDEYSNQPDGICQDCHEEISFLESLNELIGKLNILISNYSKWKLKKDVK